MNTHHSNQSKVELLSDSPHTSTRLPPKKDYAAALASLQSKYGAEASLPVIPPKKKQHRDATRTSSTVTATQASSSQQTLVDSSSSGAMASKFKDVARKSDKFSLRHRTRQSEDQRSLVETKKLDN